MDLIVIISDIFLIIVYITHELDRKFIHVCACA
jgi:hypothetical protein